MISMFDLANMPLPQWLGCIYLQTVYKKKHIWLICALFSRTQTGSIMLKVDNIKVASKEKSPVFVLVV